MKQISVTSALLLLAFAGAACSSGSGSSGTAGDAAANASPPPLVAPPTPNVGSGSTLEEQRRSGYYPDAGAPLVPPNPEQPQ